MKLTLCKATILAKRQADLTLSRASNFAPMILATDENNSPFEKMGKTSRNEGLALARLGVQDFSAASWAVHANVPQHSSGGLN
jgi:hypothetical protein